MKADDRHSFVCNGGLMFIFLVDIAAASFIYLNLVVYSHIPHLWWGLELWTTSDYTPGGRFIYLSGMSQ